MAENKDMDRKLPEQEEEGRRFPLLPAILIGVIILDLIVVFAIHNLRTERKRRDEANAAAVTEEQRQVTPDISLKDRITGAFEELGSAAKGLVAGENEKEQEPASAGEAEETAVIAEAEVAITPEEGEPLEETNPEPEQTETAEEAPEAEAAGEEKTAEEPKEEDPKEEEKPAAEKTLQQRRKKSRKIPRQKVRRPKRRKRRKKHLLRK